MLLQQLENASRQIEYLNSQVEQLSSHIEELNKQLEEAYNKYNKLVDTIIYANMWFGWYTNKTELYKFYDNILESSINEVKRIVDLAGFSGEAGYRAFDVFEKTMLWLSYYPDNYVRHVLHNGTIYTDSDVLMLPNETWLNEGGDCEDLALFVYAILKATQRPGEKVYIIKWYPSEGSGHAAVLLVYEGAEEKEYYIIDPAGNYFNWVSIQLNMTVIDYNGTTWIITLDPLYMSYGQKYFLINNTFATIVYWDPGKEDYVNEPPIYYYTNAFDALRNWIIGYWGITNLETIEIHDIGVHKTFTSIIDAAKWLEQQ